MRMGMQNMTMQFGGNGNSTSQTIRINYGGSGAPNIRMSSQQTGPHPTQQMITVQSFHDQDDDGWEDDDESEDSGFDDHEDNDYDEDEEDDEFERHSDEVDSEEALPPLQVQPFARTTKSIPDTCVICMENFNRNHRDASFLECQHWFHKQCVGRWMQDNRSCPQCKFETNVLFANEDS